MNESPPPGPVSEGAINSEEPWGRSSGAMSRCEQPRRWSESIAKAAASGSLASVSRTASSHKFYKPVSDEVKGDPKCGLQGFPGGSVVENTPANTGDLVRSLGGEDPLEEGMTTHSSILAWEIPWTE